MGFISDGSIYCCPAVSCKQCVIFNLSCILAWFTPFTINAVVSTELAVDEQLTSLGRSFMCNKSYSGFKLELWGRPCVTTSQDDASVLTQHTWECPSVYDPLVGTQYFLRNNMETIEFKFFFLK